MDGKEEVGKYLLFYGTTFYPAGGWDDFKGYFKTIDEAKEGLKKHHPDPSYCWAHIVHNNKIILWANARNDFDINGFWKWRDEE